MFTLFLSLNYVKNFCKVDIGLILWGPIDHVIWSKFINGNLPQSHGKIVKINYVPFQSNTNVWHKHSHHDAIIYYM